MQMMRAKCKACVYVFDVVSIPGPMDRVCHAMATARCPLCYRANTVLAEPRALTHEECAAKLETPEDASPPEPRTITIDSERPAMLAIIDSLAETALTNEREWIESDLDDDTSVMIDMTLGDCRTAVRLTNHLRANPVRVGPVTVGPSMGGPGRVPPEATLAARAEPHG